MRQEASTLARNDPGLLGRNDPLDLSGGTGYLVVGGNVVGTGCVVGDGDVVGDGRRRCEEEATLRGASPLVSA